MGQKHTPTRPQQAGTRPCGGRHRKPQSRQAQRRTLALGAVILLALIVGSFQPDTEDLAFGVMLTALLISVGLAAAVRGERVRRRPVAERP